MPTPIEHDQPVPEPETPGANDRVVVYKDASGLYRWRRVAANNRKISASGESFSDHYGAVRAAERANPGFTAVTEDDE